MKIYTYLIQKLRRRIPTLLLMTAAEVGNAILSVVFALGTKGVINAAVSGTRDDLWAACQNQAAIIAGILICLTIYRYLHNELTSVLDRDWKEDLFHSMLRGDYAQVSRYHSGELLNRLNNDVRVVNTGILSTLPGFATMVTRLLAIVTVLTAMEPWFMVIMAGLGVVAVSVTGVVRKRLRKLNKQVSEADGKVSGFLQESLEKLMLVQAMDVAPEVERRSDDLLEGRYRLQRKRLRISVVSNTCVSIMVRLSSFAALAWCAVGVFTQAMTFGDLTAITQLVSQLQGPFVNMSSFYPQYIAMMAAAERLMEIEEICGRYEGEESLDGHKLYKKMTAIYAENLAFSYDRDAVLTGSDFRLPKGVFAVVTGPSGVGKSTIFKLLLGIFRPSSGSLQVETEDGSVEISRNTRKLFAYVPQGNLLFSGTLRENLLLTKPDATQAQIDEAVYCSCMDAYLSQLPGGLETVLGENAHGLSEGQAQRLAIARAVLSGAPIMLLDEVTSALDAETERLVLQRLQSLPDRTCIAVTHRPAAMDLAQWELHVEADGITCRPLGE